MPLLIALILDEKLSGMLHIEAEETKYWIYFDEGFPAGVHNPKSQAFLGAVLRELNLIDDTAFNQSLMEMAKSKRLQGQILLELGALDDADLDRGLSLQVARKLAGLFSLQSGNFEFIEDEELPPPGEPIRVNPFALIYNAIKNNYDGEALKRGLANMVGKAVRVSRLFVERGELFEFPPEDLADARILEEFRLPQEYVRGCQSGPTAAMMMLLSLLYCDMLEFEEPDFAQPMRGVRAPAPPQAAARAAAARPTAARAGGQAQSPAGQAAARSASGGATPAQQKASEVSDSLRTKINDKFEQVKVSELWEILEVEKEADSTRLKKAFLTLAKVYHPDRVAGANDEELQHRMDVILAKVNEAYQVLSDPHARMAYMAKGGKKSEEGPSGHRSSEPRPEEARVQFQKAMVYLKKRDLVKTAEAVRWAADLDPNEPDYLAWQFWVEYLRSDLAEDEKLQTAKGDLLALAKQHPDSFPANRFLANLFLKLNDKPNYEKFLVRAHKLDPKDVETARELRLYRTRKEKEDKKGKFLGIRFKK